MGDLKNGETFVDCVFITLSTSNVGQIGLAPTCTFVKASDGTRTAGTIVEIGLGWYKCTDFVSDADGTWLTEWAVVGNYIIHYPFKEFKVGGGVIADVYTDTQAINALHVVPAQNAAINSHVRDVAGNKTDAAVTVVGVGNSILAYIKGCINQLAALILRTALPAQNNIGNTYTAEVIGNKTDAANVTADQASIIGLLRYITHPWTRVQSGTQATTNLLVVIGVAIENATIPFEVNAYISLHNMIAGDTFLVIEEVRDSDDVTYRELGRTTFYDVQTSPMVWFEAKICMGWRLRIQRTGGADRDVTYQIFRRW